MDHQENRFLPFLTLLTDATAVLAAVLWLPNLATYFTTRNSLNVIWITAVFFTYCIAVYLIRKLEPQISAEAAHWQVPAWLTKRLVMAVLAAIFSLSLAALMLDQVGYWQSIFEVDDRALGAGESSAYFVFAPGAFLAISFFYILVLSGQTRETILLEQPRYLPLALLGLLAVNGMMLLFTAVFQAINLPLWLVLPSLIVLFGPPRLWYVTKRPSWPPVVTFLVLIMFMLGYGLWR